MGEADTAVCLKAKQIMPPITIRIALICVSRAAGKVPALETLRLLAPRPKLKISSNAPNTIPLTPASESMRLPASEKQWMAPKEEISITARTTIDAADKPVGMLRGLLMLIGKDRTVIARLTTPPMTKSMAARSTKPCFSGETPFNFL